MLIFVYSEHYFNVVLKLITTFMQKHLPSGLKTKFKTEHNN